MLPGDTHQKTLRLVNDGSLDATYGLWQVQTGGDNGLCSALEINASLGGISRYNGPLSTFTLSPFGTLTSISHDWTFTITLSNDDEALSNKTCAFDLHVKAWQTDSDGTWGLRDEEILSNSITTGIFDTTPPTISNITIGSPGEHNTKVPISWDTDEPATTVVEWGTTTTYGHIATDTMLTNHHTFDIPNLIDYQLYHFRIKSTDEHGNESISSDRTFRIVNLLPTPSSSSIVINEFLPDPFGSDNAAMPGGEWVELYNTSTTSINVNNWKLCDFSILPCQRPILISSTNTNTGDTWIPGKGYLVVFLNGTYPGWMNNDGGDMITLYNASNTQIDQRGYFGITVVEGKTFARFPDGSIFWYDPIATPGQENILESSDAMLIPDSANYPPAGIIEETNDSLPTETPTPTPSPPVDIPTLSITKKPDGTSVSFTITNIGQMKTLSYTLTYDTNTESQGIMGSITLDNQSEYTKNAIILGSCSTGGICTYHEGVKNIQITVILKDTEGKETTLTQSL